MARALSFTARQLFLRQQAMHVVCWRQIHRCMSQGSSRGGSPGKGGPKRKVAVLGAAGGIGQPLGLLMKLSPLVTDLALFDIAGTPGVACDLSHVNTQAKVEGFAGDGELGKALTGCDLVIIPAGVPRKPGMTRDDLFKINAGIVKNLCKAIAEHCPKSHDVSVEESLQLGNNFVAGVIKALVNIISNPVNSTVPIAAEVFKQAGTYDKAKLFGVTTLDVVRARTFYAAKKGIPVEGVDLPVVGGHAGITILPLFSQATPKMDMTEKEIDTLTKRTQDGGTEVVQAKAGKGSATLSMAYAGALFAEACLKGLNGQKNVIECSYVESTITDIPFFSSKVRLGPKGIAEVLGLGKLTAYEKKALDAMAKELKASIRNGIEFVKK